jgi:hypothetical protein
MVRLLANNEIEIVQMQAIVFCPERLKKRYIWFLRLLGEEY